MIDILDGTNPYVEAFAAIEHLQWAQWTTYFFSKCQMQPNGCVVVPAEYVAALLRLATTTYAELSDEQKANDRREVARYWGIVMGLVAQAAQGVGDAG